MLYKEKAGAQPPALEKSKTLIVDLKTEEYYRQSKTVNFPLCSIPKSFRFFSGHAWFYLREEIGSDEAEILRDLDYWIKKNFRKWKRPKVYWTYETFANRIRIPKRTLQRKIGNLVKLGLVNRQGSGPLWFMINYTKLLELQKNLMDKVATHDAKLATYLLGTRVISE